MHTHPLRLLPCRVAAALLLAASLNVLSAAPDWGANQPLVGQLHIDGTPSVTHRLGVLSGSPEFQLPVLLTHRLEVERTPLPMTSEEGKGSVLNGTNLRGVIVKKRGNFLHGKTP